MPFALGLIAILLIVAGARGTYKELGDLLKDDFSGEHSFFWWILALAIMGMVGYIPGWEKLSRAFMGLILFSMVLSNQEHNFFKKLTDAFNQITPAKSPVQDTRSGIPTTPQGKGIQSPSSIPGALQKIPLQGFGTT